MLSEDHEISEDSEGESDQYGDESADDDVEVQEEFGDRIKEMLSFSEPYDPSTEPLPNMAAYHPSFPVVEAACKEIADRAVQILKSSDYVDLETARLIEQISARREIKYSPPKKIGMIGNSGVGKWQAKMMSHFISKFRTGKSSLINAVLDTPDLAAEVSLLGSGTHKALIGRLRGPLEVHVRA